KTVLHEQRGFDGRFPMSIQELVEEFLIEFARIDFRRTISPPTRFAVAVMKTNLTKLARIGEDESAVSLIQNEMIVFAGLEIRRFNVRLAGHAEMNPEPAPKAFA